MSLASSSSQRGIFPLLGIVVERCSQPLVMMPQLEANMLYWSGEMAQWLRALVVLPEDPGSIPSTHMLIHNCL